MPLKETQLSHKISFSPISKEKRQKKSSIALAYIILSLVKFQSTNLCCTAILMTGQHATVTDAFKKMTLHEEESSSLRWRSFHDINSLNKLQQGRNALLRKRPTRQKQARERISFFFYCVTTSWAHRVHVECTADVQLSCVFSHQFFIPVSPSWNCFSFYPPSNLSHVFSPEKKDYSFWPHHSTQNSLKSEKQECFTSFESQDTCSSITGVQFQANS